MRQFVWYLLIIVFLSAFLCSDSAPLNGQEAKPKTKESAESDDKPAKAKKKSIETVTAKKKPISVFQKLSGLLESSKATEVETDFEKWSDLKIEKVAEQGPVKKGDVLVKFDTETMEKAVTDAKFSLSSAKFAHKAIELAAEKAKKTFELDDAMAKLAWKTAQEDYQYYQDVEVPQRKKDLAYDERSAGYRLEYAKDELDQLQQMYTEDELTEESEAIVLKRAERSVESATRGLERSMRYIKRSREFSHPRTDQQRENSFERAKMAFEKSRITLPIAKDKAELAVAKSKNDLQKKMKDLDEMVADSKKMTIVAPVSGFMFYGKADRGKWGAGAGGRDLKVDDKVKAKAVVMTIVDNSELSIRASVAENDVDDFVTGLKGNAKFESAGGKLVPVTIKSVARVPMADGKFDCVVQLDAQPGENMLAGMGCKMNFQVYENDDAIVVPKSSVFSDDDGFSNYVYVGKDDAKKVDVVLGRTSGKHVEVLSGLKAGDEIRKTKPTGN
jgi:multidrug efflux pump subunit AcrA (membrane-fusion protein)